MKYSDVCTFHEDYCAGNIKRVNLMYNGGHQFDKNINLFIPKMRDEHESGWIERISNSSNVNHLNNIVGTIKNFLLENRIIISLIPEQNDKWQFLCDDLVSNCELIVTDLLLHGRSFIGINDVALNSDIKSIDQLQQIELPDIEKIPIEEIINWRFENDKLVEFVRRQSKCVNESLIGNHDEKYDVFTHCVLIDGIANVTVYQSPAYKKTELKYNKFFGVNQNIFEFGSNAISNSELTIVDQYQLLSMPIQMICVQSDACVGQKIFSLIVEHMQRRSKLIVAESRGLCSIPTVFLGPSIVEGQLNLDLQDKNEVANLQSTPKELWSEKGFVVFNSGDEFKFVEPDGKIFQTSHQMQQDLVDDIYKTAFLSSLTNKSQSHKNQSGLSKEIDMIQLRLIVSFYASKLKKFLEHVILTILQSRALDDVLIHVSGLDQSSNVDTVDSIKSEVEIAKLLEIPSKTFSTIMKQRIAHFLLKNSASPDLLFKINNEIAEEPEEIEESEESDDKEEGMSNEDDKEDASSDDSGESNNTEMK